MTGATGGVFVLVEAASACVADFVFCNSCFAPQPERTRRAANAAATLFRTRVIILHAPGFVMNFNVIFFTNDCKGINQRRFLVLDYGIWMTENVMANTLLHLS